MRTAILLIFSLLLLFPFVYGAMNVTLLRPSNNAPLEYEINNVQFICYTPGADAVRLFTTINGSWSQTGNTVTNVPSNGNVTFVVTNVPVGTYKWNCFATGINGVGWAPQNFTFSFSFPPNDQPVCNGTFPQISLQKNTPQTNVLNLRNYITDQNNDALTFSFSGDSNVDITLKDTGFIDISPKQNRVAIDQVYVKANDGKSSDIQCGPLIVSISDTSQGNTTSNTTNNQPSNTAPQISPDIPDQTKDSDVSSWTLDLDDYGTDDKPKSELNWTVENVGNDVVKISINVINHEVKFERVGAGSDTVRFVAKDAGGLSDEQNVKITITASTGNQANTQNEDTDEFDETDSEVLKITQHTPGSSDPILEEKSSLSFSIEVNEENPDILWYLNGEQVEEDSNLFNFTPETAGQFNISVLVSKDGEEDDYVWNVEVIPALEETAVTNMEKTNVSCGNDIIDEEENCESCPDDVVCEGGEQCVDKECIVQGNMITGFSIADLRGGSLIGTVAAGIVVILFILIMIIRAMNKQKIKGKNRTLSSFQPKIKEIEPRKEHVLKTLEKEKSAIPSGIEPIIGFIQSGLASGDHERVIKKSLIKSGWNRKQIKEAFRSINRKG